MGKQIVTDIEVEKASSQFSRSLGRDSNVIIHFDTISSYFQTVIAREDGDHEDDPRLFPH